MQDLYISKSRDSLLQPCRLEAQELAVAHTAPNYGLEEVVHPLTKPLVQFQMPAADEIGAARTSSKRGIDSHRPYNITL